MTMVQAQSIMKAAPRITVIDPRPPEQAKLRVAAYARVSSDSEDQLNSYIAQVKSKGYVDPALYLSQQDEITHKLKELKKLRRRALEASGEDQQLQNTEAILEYLEDSGRPFQRETVDEELFEFLIQRLTVYSAETVKFRLYNGLELAETMERAVR